MSEDTRAVGGILNLPESVDAILWDLDGVLVDTLGADHSLCVAAANTVFGEGDWIDQALVQQHFALDPEAFWAELLKAAPFKDSNRRLGEVVTAYNKLRAAFAFSPISGVEDILCDSEERGITCVVASSNPIDVVKRILTQAGLGERFAHVAGLGDGAKAKPEPDLYILAARAIGVAPKRCAFVEDSVTGLRAGRAAEIGFAIAVATGPARFEALEASRLADVVYDRFERPRCALVDGKPTQKRLDTPNDFVSHMVEHIAWRLGVGIDLSWRSNDWRALGSFLGRKAQELGFRDESAAALGMIDDGASEVLISFDRKPGLDFDVHAGLPAARVKGMRVEQVREGRELLDMLEGFSHGIGAHITARMCTFEDPHHSWEGLYRAVGICLARLRARDEARVGS